MHHLYSFIPNQPYCLKKTCSMQSKCCNPHPKWPHCETDYISLLKVLFTMMTNLNLFDDVKHGLVFEKKKKPFVEGVGHALTCCHRTWMNSYWKHVEKSDEVSLMVLIFFSVRPFSRSHSQGRFFFLDNLISILAS